MWELWSNYSVENRFQYYLGNPNTLSKINSRLLSITPPEEIHRHPRPITERAKWKASEWKSFGLYYAVICLKGLLNQKYLKHFGLLVASVYKLLKTQITSDDLHLAEANIKLFVAKFEELYGAHSMTFNVHILLHLKDSVVKNGPLWANSTFAFESGIFKLKKQVKGPVGVVKQISNKICNTNLLLHKINHEHNLQHQTKLFINNLFTHKQNKHISRNNNCVYLGSGFPIQDKNLRSLISSIAPNKNSVNEALCYNKCINNKTVFKSITATKPKKTNDAYINTKFGFAKILGFVCSEFGDFTYIEKLTSKHFKLGDLVFEHIFILDSQKGEKLSIKTADITEKCVYVNVGNSSEYICTMPNHFEIQ